MTIDDYNGFQLELSKLQDRSIMENQRLSAAVIILCQILLEIAKIEMEDHG
jgi:hypothetical protein